MIRFKNTQFRLTELAYALEEVIIRPYQLTGYLDVDKETFLSTTTIVIKLVDCPMWGMRLGIAIDRPFQRH